MDSPPLHALRNTNGVVNGVYSYSGSSTFPTSSTDATNYWVDPVFTPQAFNTPPARSAMSTRPPATPRPTVTWSAPTTGDPVNDLHHHALHRIGRPDPDDGHREPGADLGRRVRPDQRHDLHVHGHRVQPGRHRPRVRAVQRGDTVSERAACQQRRLRERPDLLDDRWRGPADREHHPVPLRQRLRLARHGAQPATEPNGDSNLVSDGHYPSVGHDDPEFLVPAGHGRRHLLGQRLHVRLAGGPDPHHIRADAGQRVQEQLELADAGPRSAST